MVQVQTKLKAADNSGARFVQCIKALKGFNRTYAFCGDFILISIKKLRLIRKVKVGEIHLGVVSRTVKETRFFGWVSRNLRQKKFLRILILCGYNLI
jgi:large subunit ribosomal protein L14